ncbi:hypothetical protein B296_00001252 [Ensete ventricosum]|uniref:Uncharacterized protein n=1 Tax=Ensete ventricosum TaxID=4639 RepID=A0A427B1F5_ENSVE|nr:hypothetical protein B296_00001252 [Ensete ventricosum]
MLKPVIPLDHVSLEVYYSDVYHGCIWSLVIVKISFRARDPLGDQPSLELYRDFSLLIMHVRGEDRRRGVTGSLTWPCAIGFSLAWPKNVTVAILLQGVVYKSPPHQTY